MRDVLGAPSTDLVSQISYGETMNPLVLARLAKHPDRPTIFVYGHYDVQPVDEVRGWRAVLTRHASI